MRAPARPPSHRRRFLVGLASALLLAVGVGLALLNGVRTADRHQLGERKAVVTLGALTELIEQAGGGEAQASEGGLGDELAALDAPQEPEEPAAEESGGMGLGDELAALEAGTEEQAPDPGEKVRQAVARFAATHPQVRSVRVITFEGIRLEASTDPADQGERAAPRRLERDEKPLYDLGQKLRAAVSENRESTEAGEAVLNEEVAVERQPDGGLVLSRPVERGGEVTGMVQMRTAPDPASAPPRLAWLPALVAWLAPVVLLFLLSLVIGERRAFLGLTAVALLVLGLFFYARWALGVLGDDRRASGQSLAAHVLAEAQATAPLAAELGLPQTAADPSHWDVDLYRRPRALITSSGTVDEGHLGEEIRRDASRLTRTVAWIAAITLVLLVFVGLGGASRTGRALVAHRVAYTYTVPGMIGMILLAYFPFLYGFALSFTNSNIYNTNKPVTEIWVGLDNYKDILSDFDLGQRTPEGFAADYGNFYWTLGFTIIWTITNVAIGVTLGLVLALALNTRGLALRPVYRVLLILPWAVPTYITALTFQGMFHRQFGVINQMRQIVGFDPVSWFDSPLTSFIAVLTTNSYLSFSFMMVVCLGALQSIPADLYEAARVDGASRWQQFKSITMPSLRPALVPAIILSVIWTFNQIIVIFLVSGGQPAGATEILISRAYKLAFEQYRYGYAAAYSTVIFVILYFYGLFQNRVTRATEAISE